MANYRIRELDVSIRLELAARMINPAREWGEVTSLARKHKVSRKFLYEQRDKAEQVLRQALQPQRPGPRKQTRELEIDRAFLRRATLVMATAIPGSVRGIQMAMELLFGEHRAIGWISQQLQEFGATAKNYLAESRLEISVLG